MKNLTLAILAFLFILMGCKEEVTEKPIEQEKEEVQDEAISYFSDNKLSTYKYTEVSTHLIPNLLQQTKENTNNFSLSIKNIQNTNTARTTPIKNLKINSKKVTITIDEKTGDKKYLFEADRIGQLPNEYISYVHLEQANKHKKYIQQAILSNRFTPSNIPSEMEIHYYEVSGEYIGSRKIENGRAVKYYKTSETNRTDCSSSTGGGSGGGSTTIGESYNPYNNGGTTSPGLGQPAKPTPSGSGGGGSFTITYIYDCNPDQCLTDLPCQCIKVVSSDDLPMSNRIANARTTDCPPPSLPDDPEGDSQGTPLPIIPYDAAERIKNEFQNKYNLTNTEINTLFNHKSIVDAIDNFWAKYSSEDALGAIYSLTNQVIYNNNTISSPTQFLNTAKANIAKTLKNLNETPFNPNLPLQDGEMRYGNWGTAAQPNFGTMAKLGGSFYFWRDEVVCGEPCFTTEKKPFPTYYKFVNNKWKVSKKPTQLQGVDVEGLKTIYVETMKILARYNMVIDLEAFHILLTGKDLDGKNGNKALGGVLFIVDVTPAGKATKGAKFVVKKTLGAGVFNFLAKNGDELIKITNNTVKIVKKEAWEHITTSIQSYKKFDLEKGKLYLSRTQFRKLMESGDVLKVKIENLEQKQLFEDILAGIDPQNKLEELTGAIYKEAGYTTHTFKQVQIGNSGTNGFDGIFIKKDASGKIQEIVVNESKFLSNFSTEDIAKYKGLMLNGANKSTGLPVQLSDEWIQNVINRMLKDTEPQHIRELGQQLEDLWEDSPEIFTKIVSTVDTYTNEFVITQLGYVYRGW